MQLEKRKIIYIYLGNSYFSLIFGIDMVSLVSGILNSILGGKEVESDFHGLDCKIKIVHKLGLFRKVLVVYF